jgi:hypothetical protein
MPVDLAVSQYTLVRNSLVNRGSLMRRLFWFALLCSAVVSRGAWGIGVQPQIVFAPFGGVNNVSEMQIANADGSNVRDLLPADFGPHLLSLAVDPRDGTIYYGGYAADYEIGRVKLDGTGRTTLYSLHALDPLVFNRSNATPSPYGISVDTVHNKLYWVGGQNNSNGFGADIPTFIQRSNLDGTNVEIVRQTLWSVSNPYSLAVSGALGKMYWTDQSDFSIRSANLDGSGMQIVLDRGTSSSPQFPWLLGGLSIDFQQQKMFWSELDAAGTTTNIMSAGLNGSDVQTLTTFSGRDNGWFDMPLVIGMAVDPTTSQLYFACSRTNFEPTLGTLGALYRVNYDGTNLQTVIANTPRPFGLALMPVPEPGGWVSGAWVLGRLAMSRRRSTSARRA